MAVAPRNSDPKANLASGSDRQTSSDVAGGPNDGAARSRPTWPDPPQQSPLARVAIVSRPATPEELAASQAFGPVPPPASPFPPPPAGVRHYSSAPAPGGPSSDAPVPHPSESPPGGAPPSVPSPPTGEARASAPSPAPRTDLPAGFAHSEPPPPVGPSMPADVLPSLSYGTPESMAPAVPPVPLAGLDAPPPSAPAPSGAVPPPVAPGDFADQASRLGKLMQLRAQTAERTLAELSYFGEQIGQWLAEYSRRLNAAEARASEQQARADQLEQRLAHRNARVVQLKGQLHDLESRQSASADRAQLGAVQWTSLKLATVVEVLRTRNGQPVDVPATLEEESYIAALASLAAGRPQDAAERFRQLLGMSPNNSDYQQGLRVAESMGEGG